MKIPAGAFRKSIAYAYPTSLHAKQLGHGETGCFYAQQEVMREDGTWSSGEPWPGREGEACMSSVGVEAHALLSLFHAIPAVTSPFCMAYRLSI